MAEFWNLTGAGRGQAVYGAKQDAGELKKRELTARADRTDQSCLTSGHQPDCPQGRGFGAKSPNRRSTSPS